jgi:transcription elongation factor Elf1
MNKKKENKELIECSKCHTIISTTEEKTISDDIIYNFTIPPSQKPPYKFKVYDCSNCGHGSMFAVEISREEEKAIIDKKGVIDIVTKSGKRIILTPIKKQ